ncbi:ATP-binding protein, partial [Thiotrichales bacterium HSG1]|nr:ATP-binding protein [Thiotrichales bacterium HSG1]
MEVIASILAYLVGVIALVRFYSKQDGIFLFIGTGFLGTGLFDTYHAIVTSTFFDFSFQSSSSISWSWVASRLFLAISLWFSLLAWRREQRLGKAGIINKYIVYLFAVLLIVSCFIFFVFVPLPSAYYPDLFFKRPEEFIPAIFFLLALIGYLKKGGWQEDNFEHWLILSLIVSFMGQVMFMSFSGHSFDIMFDSAHLLKKVSYIFVLIGLLANIYIIHIRNEESVQQLSEANTFFNKVIDDVVLVSQGLAKGDLTVRPQVTYKGDFIQIKNSLESTTSNLQLVVGDIMQISQGLAEGGKNIVAKAEYQGDFAKIKDALETAANNTIKLAETTAINDSQNWLKTGQTQLNNEMSGEQEIAQLSKNIITFISTYLDMPVGMFYLLDENGKDTLKLTASYAYTLRKGVNSEFKIGTGLVGQAALEQKELIITKVPEDYYVRIRSGIGQALPNTVIVQPFMYENSLKGVIELAAFKPISPIQHDFLQQVMPDIGIAINSANSRSQMQNLLQQSQTQAEELQSQSEELQSQQEELRQTNEILEQRSKDLEGQKEEIRNKNQSLESSQIEMEKAQAAIETKAAELELASKYKSEFLANMSHELRTPLNSLLILAQLLENNKTGNLNDKQIEYAKTIHNAGSDLLKLINEILDLSKVEAGKIEINREDVVLGDLVASIDEKFRHVAQDKKLDFHITVADNLPTTINTDGQRLIQIINNLLSNAFKFTKSGEVHLLIQYPEDKQDIVTLELDLSKTIAIVVVDSGIGIPKDKQRVIFEAFQQVDGTTSRRYGGTGLGLSISRQLAKLLGGVLTLHSEEGKGCTFTIYLPMNLSSKAVISEKTPKINESTEVKESFVETPQVIPNPIGDDRDDVTDVDKSLLIIEDDRKFSKILLDLAREKGFKCIIAEDGKTGLQLAEQYAPNAIILDVGLPQVDGWTVMERLKDSPSTRHIPVHFMSGSDQEKTAKKMGAIGYLLKPINMTELGGAFEKIEGFIAKTLKNLLVLANDEHRQDILQIVDDDSVVVTT